MATYIQRAQALIEAATNSVSTVAQQQRIAAAFVGYSPNKVAEILEARPLVEDLPGNPGVFIKDTSPLTNEEKAKIFVDSFLDWGRSILQAEAEKQALEDSRDTITDAGNAAIQDLEVV